MNVIKARKQWLRTRGQDAVDVDDDVLDAFAAGWNAALPVIRGTGQGATHNGATRPGGMEVTIWGHTKRGRSIALVYDEEGAARLKADLERFGIGL